MNIAQVISNADELHDAYDLTVHTKSGRVFHNKPFVDLSKDTLTLEGVFIDVAEVSAIEVHAA